MDLLIRMSFKLILSCCCCFMFSAVLAQEEQILTEAEVNQAVFSDLPNISGIARLIGPGFDQDVEFFDAGAYGIVESDIYVPLIPPLASNNTPLDVSDVVNDVAIDGFRWPNQTLYYQFSDVTEEVKSTIRAAAKHIEDRTNVLLVEIADSSVYHVLISDDIASDETGRRGCSSQVGRRTDFFGGQGFQRMNMQRTDENGISCSFLGIAVHEFLHALGVWHEQSRQDRNLFVEILFGNIQAGREHNFNQQISGATDVGQYDYASIMHYGAFDFSSNGLPTIRALTDGVMLGQRQGMTIDDVNTINTIYPIPKPQESNTFLIPLLMLLLFGDEASENIITN